jgi:hypothetical protein
MDCTSKPNQTTAMIAYALFFIIATIACCVLPFVSEDVADWLLERKRTPRFARPLLLTISTCSWIRGWAFFGVWIVLVIGLPAVYEFPRWEKDKNQTWLLERNDIKGRKIQFQAARSVPWYGAFHRFSLDGLGLTASVPIGPVRKRTVITVEDVKLFKKYRITLDIHGDDWLEFVLDMNNAQSNPNPFQFYLDEKFVTNNFVCVLQQAQMPVDQVPGQAVALCNAWLESQDIDSVQAVLVKVENMANPERLVWGE